MFACALDQISVYVCVCTTHVHEQEGRQADIPINVPYGVAVALLLVCLHPD